MRPVAWSAMATHELPPEDSTLALQLPPPLPRLPAEARGGRHDLQRLLEIAKAGQREMPDRFGREPP